MKKILVFLVFLSVQKIFGQNDTLVAFDTLLPPEMFAKYPGGLRDFKTFFSYNFNFYNLKSEELTAQERNKKLYVFYVKFSVNAQGDTKDFYPVNTLDSNSFYKEAVRVLQSTKWEVSKKDSLKLSQGFVLPIQLYTSDLQIIFSQDTAALKKK